MRKATLCFILLDLISLSASFNSDSPFICDNACDKSNKEIFYNVFGIGLGWLVLIGDVGDINTVVWQQPASLNVSLSDANSRWTLINGNALSHGQSVLQSWNNYKDTFTNLEPHCDSSSTLDIVFYTLVSSISSLKSIDSTWSLGLNADGTNWLLNTKNCSKGSVQTYLGATPANPKGALVFYAWNMYILETAVATVYQTVTQGVPTVVTVLSGIGTSTTTAWVYVTQPVTQTTTVGSVTIYTTASAPLKRRDTLPTPKPTIEERAVITTNNPTSTTFRSIVVINSTVAISSGTLTAVVPTSTQWSTVTATSILQPVEIETITVPSVIATVYPKAAAAAGVGSPSNSLSISDKIAIGVGLGVGIPTLLIAGFAFWFQIWKDGRSRSAIHESEG